MASIIIASLSLAISFAVVVYGAWRRVRGARFRVIYACATAEPEGDLGDSEPVRLKSILCDVVAIGGGSDRTVVDARVSLSWVLASGTALEGGAIETAREVEAPNPPILVPAGAVTKFRLSVDQPSMIVGQETAALKCVLEIDAAVETVRVPFGLRRTGAAQVYVFWGSEKWYGSRPSLLRGQGA